jgi:hypothetical protein
MNLAIVLGGLTILVCMAVLIGYIDAHARDAAWRRITAAVPTRQLPRRRTSRGSDARSRFH